MVSDQEYISRLWWHMYGMIFCVHKLYNQHNLNVLGAKLDCYVFAQSALVYSYQIILCSIPTNYNERACNKQTHIKIIMITFENWEREKSHVISRVRHRDLRTWSENAATAPKGKENFGKKIFIAHWAMNLSFFRKSPYGTLIWHIVCQVDSFEKMQLFI